ncbi:HAD family hydrolase [Apibacter sp. HY039]|uniref:HAD family hydrolase n=1 Tax=Apibacter sp. HY039 TaxID=2501476 RepID=UPI000FEBDA4D|nr:HAD family hydrolase [Apibacter sp. HY039]
MIKLVIFDLDGTLLNTIEDLANSGNYILKKYGFPEHPVDSYRFFVGKGVGKLIERALPEVNRQPEFIEQLRQEFIEYYNLHSDENTAPYPGIISMLKSLGNQGIKLAVASNKYHLGTQALVTKYFSDIAFDVVLGQREGVPAKPDPQIVYDIMKESGISDVNTILYVGDTATDMKTAASSGIKSIGVLWGFRPKEELVDNGAVFLVKKAEDILIKVEEFSD